MKYIFITGGVISGLGKGITAASLGRLLKFRDYKVAAQKIDPYLNIDSGTINPYQHGEVFVTEDGSETDLDLGHYERFIDEDLNKYSHLTTGKIYWNVINKERNGEYLGKTVQIIPHITGEIKRCIYSVGEKTGADIVITEIGGTTGDIESQPFLEAIRQVSLEVGSENCLFIHVTLVPFVGCSGEQKSKPTQHSVKELRAIGINPNIIVARCERPLDENVKRKISLFCNVKMDCVIENTTVPSLYAAPLMLEKNGFSSIVCRELGLRNSSNPEELLGWEKTVNKIESLKNSVTIAIVGKYVNLHDAYLSVLEALKHAGYKNSVRINAKWVEAETLTKENVKSLLADCSGVVVPGGFGSRGIEGKIIATEYARVNNLPFLGLCLGMQIAVIEFARNVLGLKDATSTEFFSETKNPVVHLMELQKSVGQKGGTMHLGAKTCKLIPGTLVSKLYGSEKISERHRHRYNFNLAYKDLFQKNGVTFSAVSEDDVLVEAIELSSNDFFVGVQFHPEFKSRPNKAHPLFNGFIKAVTCSGRACN